MTIGERIHRGPLRAVLAVAVLLLLAGAYWPVAIDDSYISAAYAYEWVARGELRWPGEARLEGYSNFAWVALQAFALRLGGPFADLPRLTKLLSLLSSIGALLLLERRLTRNATGSLILLAWLLWTPTAIWSVMALETMCFSLVCAWGYDSALRGRARGAAIGACLATLVRSDGLAWSLLILVVWWSRVRARNANAAKHHTPGADEPTSNDARDHNATLRNGLPWCGVSVLLIAAYHAWRILYFGALMPAPALLKGGLGVFGPVQLVFEAMAVLGLMFALSCLRAEDQGRGRWLLWAAPLLLSVATLLSINGDWMGTGRILLPGMLCCLLARVQLGRWQASPLRVRLTVAAIAVASMLQPQFLQPPTWRSWLPRYQDGLDTPLPAALAWLVEHTPEDGLIQAADIGILGHIPKARVRDSRGLVSPLFLHARRNQDWREVSALYRSEARPDIVLVSRFLPALLLDVLDEPTPLAPHPGLDPWLRPLDGEVLPRYPHQSDLRTPVSGGLQRGWLAAYRFHLTSPPAAVSLALQEARWRALHERFPSQPFLAEQHRRAASALASAVDTPAHGAAKTTSADR